MNEDSATPEEVAEAQLAEDAPGPLTKERVIFKGEKKRIADANEIVGKAVQLFNPKEIKAPYGARRVPGTIIVQRVSPGYNRNHKYVTYLEPLNNHTSRTVEMPDSLEVNVLTGEMGKKYNKAFSDWSKTNLAAVVPHPFVTMGCDPEIFVLDKDGEVIPAWLYLGSKNKPDYTWSNDTGYGNMPMYWDGFQAEFTTKSPLTCLGYVGDSIHAGLKGVYKAALKYDKKAKLSINSVVQVNPEILANEPIEHVEFGCMPSYNAYGLSGLPTDGRTCPIRFAGGHIHFGMAQDLPLIKDPDKLKQIIWHLDAIAGVACVSLFENWDNPVRRQYYGLPGEYRLPPHGLEYRTLSNAWLSHPLIMNLVMEVARRAYAIGISGPHNVWEATEGEVLDCILRADAEVARAILKRNKDVFIGLIRGRITYNPEGIYDVFSKDMSETIKDPADIVGNWALDGRWSGHTGNVNATWSSAHINVKAGHKV